MATRNGTLAQNEVMPLTLTVTVNLLPEGEFRVSIPLAPSPSAEGQQVLRREDKVLSLGSSILSPGLDVPLAG